MFKDRPIFSSLAKLTEEQEHSDCPGNSQAKKGHLCCDLGGAAEVAAAHKFFDDILGSNNVIEVGKSCD